MLAAARLRHIAGTQWGTKRYLKMDLLRDLDATRDLRGMRPDRTTAKQMCERFWTLPWGLEALMPAQRNDLMEIMDDRHGLTSTAMISQLPTDQWYASIGDNTLADAILDRLMHNAHRLQLKGESMRKIMGQLTDGEHLG